MGSLTLAIQYQKNLSQAISASEVKSLYFSNIPLKNPDGSIISDDTINFWIKTSQEEIEQILDVKLIKQAYEESKEYDFDDWTQWGYMPTTYPVIAGLSVKGFLNTTLQVDYPKEWLSVKRTSDGRSYHRQIHLVPVTGSANSLTNNVVFSGVAPYIGYFGRKMIPNYWTLQYTTGFNKIPDTLMKAVVLKSVISILPLASQNITGQPGIASKSISIDGLSQSVTTTASNSKMAFGAYIDQLQGQLDKVMEVLKKELVGIIFGVL